MTAIDLNCDLGEGAGTDADLIPLVTSANVACGGHAGDAATALATLELAKAHGVRAGAHPGYPDRANFGRVETRCSLKDLLAECLAQVGALAALAHSIGWKLSHLKPHGAMYHRAATDECTARAVVTVAGQFGLAVVGLPKSELAIECSRVGAAFVAEGFADRRYRRDGALVPRGEPGAMIEDVGEAVDQVEWLVRECGVRTVCVHGDTAGAPAFTRGLRDGLSRRGFRTQCEL